MSGLTIVLDEAAPLLERVQSAAQAQGLALVAARAVGILVKAHLVGLNTQRHRYGKHYYLQAAKSVTTQRGNGGIAFVTITQFGFRQRLYGGRIRAKNVRLLTIPEAPEAHGKRAREFIGLDFTFAHNPRTGALQPALVRRAQSLVRPRRVKAKDGTVSLRFARVATLEPKVMYWLTPSVLQRPDPTVLPYPEQMQARATEAITARLLRLTQRQAGGNQEGNN